MRLGDIIKDYFTFSRKDRIGIITLTGILLLVYYLPQVVDKIHTNQLIENDTSWVAAVKSLEKKTDQSGDENEKDSRFYNLHSAEYNPKNINYNKARGELFAFDPNTLPREGWQKLGVREKTIQTIQNYLSKGGKFRKPEDLQKVYGLFPEQYQRLAPYVRIENSRTNTTEHEQLDKTDYSGSAKRSRERYSPVDINQSDTTEFIALPGIGSKLANRIVNFREKLGGFYSIEQVGETFGLPDSTFQKIKTYLWLGNYSLKKININTATADELRAQPYFRPFAFSLLNYRKEHGNFTKPEDIQKLVLVTPELYQKIIPYIITE